MVIPQDFSFFADFCENLQAGSSRQSTKSVEIRILTFRPDHRQIYCGDHIDRGDSRMTSTDEIARMEIWFERI
jgi:hypothetical protein